MDKEIEGNSNRLEKREEMKDKQQIKLEKCSNALD